VSQEHIAGGQSVAFVTRDFPPVETLKSGFNPTKTAQKSGTVEITMGNTMVRGNAKLALLVMSAVAVMAQNSVVRAEDAPAEVQKLERVEVTGSNIKRTTTEGAAPLDVIDAKEIQQSGKSTIADVIHAMPSDNNGSVPASFGNGFAHGAQGVSLRGLTVNSTLVLVNGRRMATYGLGDDGQRSFVDINQIPLAIVDRIEVEKSGASAVYGSDAIAGVVNIKLKKEFTGVAFDVGYGQTYLGDGSESHASATFGKGSLAADGYNVFLNVEGSLQNAIQTTGRPGYIGTDNLTNLGFGDLRPGNPTADIPTSSRSLTGNVLDLGTGQYYALGKPGSPGTANCANADPGGFCRWDPKKGYTQIQPDTQRLNLFSRGTLRINDSVDGWLEASLFSTESKSIGNPTPTGGSLFNQATLQGVSQEVIVRPTDAGYARLLAQALPFTDGTTPTSGDNLRLRMRLGDVGPTTDDDRNTTTRVVLGITGSTAGWDWETAAGSIQSHLDSTLSGYVSFPGFRDAVRSGAYVPGGDNTAVIPTFSKPLTTKSTTKVNFVDAHGSTEVGQLPGGKVGLAFGGEFRREEVVSPAVPGTYDGSLMGLGYAAAQGSRSVTAIYAEALLPILKHLEAELAVRQDHYSDSGSTTNPQFQLKYTPIKELALRGTYARAFRAPGAYENGNSASVGFVPSVVDPKLCPIEQAAKKAGVAGVNSTPDCNFQAGVATVGNPAIKPETANSYTLGFVLEPSENYSASFDYYKIVRKNEIVQGDPNQLLPAFYASNGSLPGVGVIRDSVAGSTVVQALNAAGLNPNGYNPILLVSAGYVNASKTETSGFDIDFRARFKMAEMGTINGALNLTHIIKFRRTFPDGSFFDYAGNAGPNQLSSGAGTPNWRAKAVIAWDKDPYGLAAVVSYRGPFLNTDGSGSCNDVPSVGGGTPGCYTASFTTVDVNGFYSVTKNWEFNGGIRNITNREAPYSPLPYAVTNTAATYDASGLIGRFFSVGMRYKM
jgi:iron complex outermembrane receptor protein